MIEARLANALDRCLVAIRRGRGIEESLRPYPGLRPELDSLVLSALQLSRLPAVEFDAGSRAARRSELMDAIRREAQPRLPRPGLMPVRRLLFVPALAVAVLAAVLAGYIYLRPAGDSEAATMLTILQGDVQVETARGLVRPTDGMRLAPGDSVITGPEARAVITFIDGSTVTLAGDAVVVLRSVKESDGRLLVVLSQRQGSTWTYVPDIAGSAEVEIETPNGRVQTQSASVETTVRSGQTEVGAEAGVVALEGQTARTEVPGGHRAAFDGTGGVAAPLLVDKAPRELLLRIQGKAYAYLTDPREGTVGTVAPGVAINQITGARVEQSGDALLLRIPNPTDGQYRLGLSAGARGPISITALVRNGAADQLDATFSLEAGDNLSVGFVLEEDDLTLLGTRKETAAAPAKLVVPDQAVERANALAAATPTTTPTLRPSPTNTPRPLPTATPVPPKPTPAVAPVDNDDAPSDDAQPTSLR